MNGKQLREWRKKCGLSQKAAAEVLGVSEATIYNYERSFGKKGIPLSIELACYWIRLSRQHNVSIDVASNGDIIITLTNERN